MAEEVELRGHVVGGSYKLIRRVEDGVPSLYEAQHPRVAGRFAARLWPLTVPWDAFRRGAEIAVTLRHPGIVQVIDFNCEPGAPPFVITEWPSGMRLSYLMGTSGPIAMHRVAELIESVAWTLAAAHEHGVVHQELRPADILVIEGPSSTREWTKVDGFGLAGALARAEAAPASPYRAPEQAAPEDDGADPQSDQYALAAITYEMLSGARPPKPGKDAAEPRRLFDIVASVPAGVDAVVRKGLALEPEHRFAGIMDFARALREATDGVNTQVVRRRKLEPRNAVRAQPTEPVPVAAASVTIELARLRSSFGRALSLIAPPALRARVTKIIPRRNSARVAIALGVLVAGFGLIAPLLRRSPAPKATATIAAARPQQRPAALPHVAKPPVPPPPVAQAPTAAGPPPAATRPAPTAAAAPPAAPTLAALGATPATAAPSSPATALPAAGHAVPVAEVKIPADEAQPEEPAPAAATPAPAETAEAPRKRRPAHRTPVVKAASVGAAPKPRPLAAAATAAPLDSSLGCVINVGSKPSADVWLDDRKLNRRTPLVGYRVGCGDHKLALKREDLDLYQMEMITVRAGTPFRKAFPLQ